ncbi:MAG: hypothetical protein H0W31_00115 [Actinobacteria bacterium]|nr:hypothetical protein [Actinomycetota bacterium]
MTMTTERTGFNVREGSQILADRRAEQERSQAVADAMIRRLRIKRLAREALRLLDEAA